MLETLPQLQSCSCHNRLGTGPPIGDDHTPDTDWTATWHGREKLAQPQVDAFVQSLYVCKLIMSVHVATVVNLLSSCVYTVSEYCQNTVRINGQHLLIHMAHLSLFNVRVPTAATLLRLVNTIGPNICYHLAMMPTHHLHSDANAVEDLTSHEVGDLSLWIGKWKVYHNVPNYVANKLCWHTSPLPSLLELLPSTSLPVLQLLGFTTPRITSAILVTTPNTQHPTHYSHFINSHTCHWSVVRFPLPQVTSSDSCKHTPVKQCLMGRSQYDTGIERISSFPSMPLGHGHSFLKSTLRKGLYLTLQCSAMSTSRVGSPHIAFVLWNVLPLVHNNSFFSLP